MIERNCVPTLTDHTPPPVTSGPTVTVGYNGSHIALDLNPTTEATIHEMLTTLLTRSTHDKGTFTVTIG